MHRNTEKKYFCWRLEDHCRKAPDPFVKGTDPRIRIRIHIKMSWIRKTALRLHIMAFSPTIKLLIRPPNFSRSSVTFTATLKLCSLKSANWQQWTDLSAVWASSKLPENGGEGTDKETQRMIERR